MTDTAQVERDQAVAVVQQRPPPWRDVRILRVVGQIVFLVAVFALGWWLMSNLRTNLRQAALPSGFGFLNQPLGFQPSDSWAGRSDPITAGLRFAFFQTVRLAAVGIPLATVLGIVIGIGRLSSNWLVAKATLGYVETFRNIPPLVWILLFFSAVFLQLPAPEGSIEPGVFGWTLAVFNVRSLSILWYEPQESAWAFLVVVLVAIAATIAVMKWRKHVFNSTGEPARGGVWGLGTFVLITVGGYLLLGAPITLSLPQRNNQLIEGGFSLSISYSTVLVALSLYTASHIAEIVRGSIQAVPKGQSEAAQAIALTGYQRMRFVILPQAFRIMIPPLANQYLNLTKNTSLAVAVGFAEIVQLSKQITGNGQPAAQLFALDMLFYLYLSLTISLAANIVNNRLSLENRGKPLARDERFTIRATGVVLLAGMGYLVIRAVDVLGSETAAELNLPVVLSFLVGGVLLGLVAAAGLVMVQHWGYRAALGAAVLVFLSMAVLFGDIAALAAFSLALLVILLIDPLDRVNRIGTVS